MAYIDSLRQQYGSLQIPANVGYFNGETTEWPTMTLPGGRQTQVFRSTYPNSAYRIALTDPMDSAETGNKYGSYQGYYDDKGNLVDIKFQPHERQEGGWVSDNAWLLPLLATGGSMLMSGGLGGAGTAGWVSGESLPSGLTYSTATAGASGATMANLAKVVPYLKTLAPTALSQLFGQLPSNVANTLQSMMNGDGSGLLDLAAGYTMLDGLKEASGTAADSYKNLGDTTKGEYQFLGDRAGTALKDLGLEGQGLFSELGMNVGNTYNNLASNVGGAYKGLAESAKEDLGKFTPYAITTNLGTTNKGTFTPTAGTQGVLDSATKAAQSSFTAANDIDVNNLAKQRYDLMQSIFAEGDSAALAELRSNQAARGRAGIQSLNPANSLGEVGSNPADVAFYKALNDRNLKAQAASADQALAQRGGMLSQGISAFSVPQSVANTGMQQINTGINAGNAEFNNALAGTRLTSELGSRGIDQSTNIALRGADAVTGLFNKGIDYRLGGARAGIDVNTELAAKGIGAGVAQYVNAIGQRYEGNKAATNALFSVLKALAGRTGQSANNTGSASGNAAQLASLLKGLGLNDSQINDALNRVISDTVQSQVDMTDPFMTNDYEDNVDIITGMFG